MNKERIVSWFSCGATSAVMSKLAVRDWADKCDLQVVYCDPGGEHSSNKKFLEDVEAWIKWPITILRNPDYYDHFDVFEQRKYIAGVHGAPCTTQLKKLPREKFQRADDIHLFGFTADERKRTENIRKNSPELTVEFPLIQYELSKGNCLAMVKRAGIELPEMYKLGYGHNNCIGCPKGGQGYWNKIRVDFPEVFDRMAKIERSINACINKSYAGDGERKRIFLDELNPDAGRDEKLPEITCSLFCQAIEDGFDKQPKTEEKNDEN